MENFQKRILCLRKDKHMNFCIPWWTPCVTSQIVWVIVTSHKNTFHLLWWWYITHFFWNTNVRMKVVLLQPVERGQNLTIQKLSHSHWPSASPDDQKLPGSLPCPCSSPAIPSAPAGLCPGIMIWKHYRLALNCNFHRDRKLIQDNKATVSDYNMPGSSTHFEE